LDCVTKGNFIFLLGVFNYVTAFCASGEALEGTIQAIDAEAPCFPVVMKWTRSGLFPYIAPRGPNFLPLPFVKVFSGNQ
jgi:hypothetical protein